MKKLIFVLICLLTFLPISEAKVGETFQEAAITYGVKGKYNDEGTTAIYEMLNFDAMCSRGEDRKIYSVLYVKKNKTEITAKEAKLILSREDAKGEWEVIGKGLECENLRAIFTEDRTMLLVKKI